MKTRAEIIEIMKKEKIEYIGLKVKATDRIGMLYHLTPAGSLKDCYNNTVKKTATFEARILHDGSQAIINI